jgi:UDP-N-acetylglucosamine/UDP-N-acetylgalactosamine diphosphorylase
MATKEELTQLLAPYSQTQLLAFWDTLNALERTRLERQIQAIDFAALQLEWSGQSDAPDWSELAAKAEPPPAIRLGQGHADFSREQAIVAGEEMLKAGKVAAILVAGGQGTRLGFPQPKGMFPLGVVSKRTLFQMHVDRLLAIREKYDVEIPFLVMTSPATDAETRDYFSANNDFGLAESDVTIFCQGTMPAVDAETGQILLSGPSTIAVSPDGHGGIVAALSSSGCLQKAEEAGIEQFFYAQVDNPLVELCDPFLIGAHQLSKSQVTTQVVQKRFAKERVGNVVSIDDRVQIIEYSDLPDDVAEETIADGALKFWAGNIAVHLFDRRFLESVALRSESLPFHRAHKAVPYIDADGNRVEPESPNAVKFEKFVFDLLPLAETSIVVEGDAVEVFAPVKNAPGAETDTALTAQNAMIALHKKWLSEAGAVVSEGVAVEINPQWALGPDEVAAKLTEAAEISTDTYFS